MKSAVAAELLAWARAQRSCCPSSPYPLRRSWSTIVLGRWPQSLPGRAPALLHSVSRRLRVSRLRPR